MKTVLIFIVRLYQTLLSPLLPPGSCRFHPSCSQYAIDAIDKFGSGRGTIKALRRIARCHPFHPGGYDPA